MSSHSASNPASPNDVAARLASLSPAKLALLRKVGKTAETGGADEPPIPVRPEGVVPPLSFAQQRLWFLDRLEGPGSTYNMPNAVRLDGPLDLPAFEAVFREIVGRHESLRTNFVERDGSPVQVIHAGVECRIPVVDLAALPEAEREAEFLRLAAQEARRPFALDRDRLLRLSLVRLAPDRHVLLINIHHIVSDGWSNGNVLLREILALYTAFSQGQPSPLPPLPIQYADFACWQREWLAGARLDGQLAYWRQRLDGLPALLELPTDRPRPKLQTFAGSVHYFVLEPALVDRLKRFAQGGGATLFMALLAGFAALLARYSRQETVAIGSPIANRRRKELESLIGFFVNTLVLRAEFGANPDARALLAQVRETCLEAYRHQDVPFERLVEAIQPARNRGFSPLFQVMFILQNQNDSTAGLKIGDLHMATIPQEAASSMFDLTLKLEETAAGLSGELEYNTDLFDAATAGRFAEHYRRLLAGMVAEPECPVARLPLLDAVESRRLLAEWNATDRAYPCASVHGLFERQARRHPDRIALAWEGLALSYAGLNARAERLARYLRGLGAGPDVLVGLCVERSAAMLVGLLGILKAGAAYVPLDPGYPRERLALMIERSGLALLLTQESAAPALPESSARTVYLDRDWDAIAAADHAGPAVPVRADHLAYVIYTSGSTGLPKGVQITHGALLNFLLAMAEQPGLEADETLLAVTTISFDIAGLELYLPLIQGARIALVSRETAADGYALLDAIEQSGATAMQATPATWRMLFATGRELPVRRVFCGGEALTGELAAQLLATGAELWNLYGPTETTVWSTADRVGVEATAQASAPIGRPIGNTQVYILDQYLQPVPVGIPGELYIGGAGVARGYRHQPALTAERFLPDPYGAAPGARAYRTGDLVRYLADGRIAFLGRVDHQVKLRGFRIELGEIEAVLDRHPAVRKAVALCREDQPGQPRLVAYVEVDPDHRDAATGEVQIDKWQTVWDETYRAARPEAIDVPDFSGWLSSYTGQPIPEPEMRRWVDATVARILALQPRRVLEIGCGTGLLLSRVAPRVERYVGVDFSASVLERLAGRVRAAGWAGVELRRREATDFVPDEARTFDTVIVNSVSQYFPGVDYLLAVLDGAVGAVADGGRIFLGDVRALPLLALQHASVQFHQADPSHAHGELAQRVAGLAGREEELLLDPGFFRALQVRLPRIGAVELLLRRGTDANEMVRFRYDAVLHIGPAPDAVAWPAPSLPPPATLDDLREQLAARPGSLLLCGLPNQRLAEDNRVLDWLHGPAEPATVGEFRARLAVESTTGIDPEALWTLAESLGYAAALLWSVDEPQRRFDALIYRPGATGVVAYPWQPATAAEPVGRLEDYANHPSRSTQARRLAAELRNELEARLPAYMVPSALVCLERLPLTPNGKIDRRALPAPDALDRPEDYVAPRGADEERLATLWAEVLGVARVGIHDNFFALGGHSLLAVQVISKVRGEFGVELPIQSLFDAPTVAALAGRLVGETAGARSVLPPIPVLSAAERQRAPLSFAQQRLWFLDRLEGANVTYHISGAVRILGQLDVSALERAFGEILRRHEVLRTRFAEQDGQPVQVVDTAADFQLPVLALDGLPATARERELRHWLAGERERPFDLARDALFRATLLRLEPTAHLLHLTLHHAIADEWSIGILLQEVAALYPAFVNGQGSPLPELPVQYADYSRWQRDWLSGPRLQAQLDYWTGHLAGAPAVLDLPTDRPRPKVQHYRGRTQAFTLDAALTARIKALGRSCEATLFMVLLAGFGAVLGRYARTTDLVIGSPIANRNRAELENLIGFFVNTLPLRLDLAGRPTTRELLARVRRTALAAYDHQDVPFEHIVEELHPERSLSHAPLFQVMFVLQNAPQPAAEFAGLTLDMLDPESVAAKFDLTLSVEEQAGELRGVVEYNTDLFEAATITRLIGHYRRVLDGMAAGPDSRVMALPLLDGAERRQVLAGWNPAPAPLAEPLAIHRLFEAQAARTPARIALAHDGALLSYAALNRRANRIAHQLRALGVGPEVPVGVYGEPCPAVIAAVLGVLKAGGGYVPLVADTPPERLAYIRAETGMALILAPAPLAASLAADGAQVVDIDALLARPAPDTNPTNPLHPEQPAYIIYTSGSTGRPKGVAVSHGNLVHSVRARLDYYAADFTGLLLLQPFGFDIAAGGMFWTLCAGGCLYLEPRSLAQEPRQLLDRIAATQVSHLILLPLLYAPLLDLAGPGELDALRVVILGGERMPPELAAQHAARVPNARLHNEYGPTEATVWSTAFRVEGVAPDGGVPIGRAVGHNRCYLLDEGLNPVPVGVPGELCIGGKQVSRGYVAHAAATADKFLPDGFAAEAGARLYRTGDIARYRADGHLEFLGRADQQVKIRGFRIEPGEIESVVKEHPGVAEAAVVADERGGTKRLVAYVVAVGGGSSDPAPLAAFLKSRLPDYMIPAAWVFLDALPLTANGKLDRKALPAPEPDRQAGDPLAPRTPTETLLAGIWAAVLGVERVGVRDNFFALGGDSILSIQIVSRANRAGLGLTVKQLFQHQTIEELARSAPERQAVQAEQGMLSGPFELLPVQHWFFAGQPAEPHHFNQSVLLDIAPGLEAERVESAVHALILHHDLLRARFHGLPDAPRAEIAGSAGAVPFAVCDCAGLPGVEPAAALTADAARQQTRLDLAQGPLLRATLYRMGGGQPDRLLFIIHHLVVDGVSWRILLGDLETALAQLGRAEPIRLPPKTTAFPRWAERLRDYAASERAGAELAYWRALSAAATRPLPLDLPGGPETNTLATAEHLTLEFPAEATAALLHELPRAYRTQINDALLAALVRVFTRWTGDPRLRIVLEGHGREELFEDIDLSRTVGWFTAGFPVLLESAPDEAPAATLKRVKETLRGIPGGGLGYGVLRYLSPDPEIRAALAPGFAAEVSFNYLGRFEREAPGSIILGEAREATGSDQSQRGLRRFALEINGLLSEGRLRFTWSYGTRLHRRETIERLAGEFFAELDALVREARAPDAGGYTASDFPLAKLDGPGLELLFRRWERRVEDAYPLSPMQQGMLFHSLYDDGAGAYVIQMACALGGEVRPEPFRRAWQRVLDRHPSLRTAILAENGAEPVQVVLGRVELPWRELDWRGLAPDGGGDVLAGFLAEDRAQGFAVDAAPLLRCTLIRLAESEWRFVWTHHHVLTDGWCLPILMREVLHFYGAFVQGRDADLPSPRPYRDYIAWLGRQDLAAAEAFWRANLAGFAAPTALGVDRPAPVGAVSAYRECALELDADTSRALQNLARSHRLTLGVLVQGAWAALLGRYGGTDNVLFGATVAGRPPEIADVDAMVGLFINTLPVRARLDGGRSLLDWLAQLRDEQLARDGYAYTPLVSIHGWSGLSARQPLFESIVIFENYPMDETLEERAGTLAIRDVRLLEQTNFPLTLTAAAGTRIPLRLAYDTARFDEQAAARMLGHLGNLLAGLAAVPDQTVGAWSARCLMEAVEQRRLRENWNRTAVQRPGRGRTLPALFEAQVQRAPHRIAAVFGDERWSYGRLNRRANQIAQRLRGLGVVPGVLVGLCVERSLDMLAGLMAIQKAGGAYVPLDPGYPAERLAFMLEDGGVPVVLSQTALRDHLPATGARVLCLDDPAEFAAVQGAANPVPLSGPGDLAYVIYTSGSTGKPKGVRIGQDALVNFLLSMAETPGLDQRDTLLAVTTISFDIAGLELYLPLLVGAGLVLVGRETAADGPALLAEMQRTGATVMQATPATWRLLLEAGWQGAPLRRGFCGGEGFPKDLAARMAATGIEVWNLYGPTETTVWSAAGRVSGRDDGEVHEPIGRPIDNTRLYVVDRAGRPTPQGVPGELLIGGDGLAQGYFKRPGLTAEKFIPDPFGGEPGGRLYRSGDLARYREEGDLACLGRIDHQVKIRGFRIELGEIEARLAERPEVKQAAVTVWAAGADDQRLVAYVLAEAGAAPDADSLRAWLREVLPAYMVPTEWVFPDSFPLTPNGKLDRRALPAPDRAQRGAYTAPRTPTGARLADLVAEVLGVERVGADDDFFDLGGHSLLAAKLVSRIRQAFALVLPLPVLFQKPTVEQLADHIDTTLWAVGQGAAPATALQDDEEEFTL